MRVCLFCHHFYPHLGGNETQSLLLARELTVQGVEVMVVTARINQSYLKYEEYDGIKIYRVGELGELIKGIKRFTNRLGLTKADEIKAETSAQPKAATVDQTSKLRLFADQLNMLYLKFNAVRKMSSERANYDLIHSQMLSNVGYIALRAGLRSKKPVLIKDATLGGLSLVKSGFRLDRQRRLLREKANFVAISSRIYDNLLSQGISSDHIFRISNGINISTIDSKSNSEAMSGTLLYVGNFWQGDIKGLDILIQAMGAVVAKHSQVRLSIAGEGDIEPYMKIARSVGADSNIDYLGQVKDVSSLYATHSVFILPSRSEGMSNATLEAMSYGMPCVVSDVSGSSDQIDSGTEGLIVPVGDSHSLALAIIEMLDNPMIARKMGDAAKEKIRREFDIKVTTAQYIKVYKQLIEN